MQSKNKFSPGTGYGPGSGVVRSPRTQRAGESQAVREPTIELQKVRRLALVRLRYQL